MSASATPATDYDEALPVGSLLGEFKILKVLGRGGFGITYLAHDAARQRDVVLKESLPATFAMRRQDSYRVVPRGGGDSGENFRWATENFMKEAQLLASLHHPNIVPVYKAFSAIGTAFYVMPWMGGMDLAAYASQAGGLNEEQMRGMLHSLLNALSYLHSHNLLHRDIKPGNILCTEDGTPILIDFGTARAMVSERSQTVVESAGYTPMEQMQSHGNTGPWTDLYALGATCYKLITGDPPPRSSDRVGEEDAYRPLAERDELLKRYSPVLLGSIDKALGLWPKHRWQSADEWKAILAPAEEGKQGKLFPGHGELAPSPLSSVPAAEPPATPAKKSHPIVPQARKRAGRKRVRRGIRFKNLVVGGLLLLGIVWGCFEFGSSSAEALYNQGLQYAKGNGVVRNEKEAVKFFRKAAKKGHSNAQYELGNCYYDGVGVPKNMQIAAEWYRKAANQGNDKARYALRKCYESGVAPPENPENAQIDKPEDGVSRKPENGVSRQREVLEQGIISQLPDSSRSAAAALLSELSSQDMVTYRINAPLLYAENLAYMKELAKTLKHINSKETAEREAPRVSICVEKVVSSWNTIRSRSVPSKAYRDLLEIQFSQQFLTYQQDITASLSSLDTNRNYGSDALTKALAPIQGTARYGEMPLPKISARAN